MLVPDASQDARRFKLTSVEDYEPLIGGETVERLLRKAEALSDLHIINVNSTYYGGGVAEILSSLTLLMNASGIRAGWRVIQGRPDFFSKKMHNALQGGDINLTDPKVQIYEEVAFENASRLHIDQDVVIVHDPQPLPLIQHFRKKAPWIWRCHVDLSQPHPDVWAYLAPLVERYDAVVLSLPEYAQKLATPQRFIMPAINPFSTTNKALSDAEIADRFGHYDIPTDLPLVVQVSRFDKWKDPQGVSTLSRSRAARWTARWCWSATWRPTIRKARRCLHRCADAPRTASASSRYRTPRWSMPCSGALQRCYKSRSARASGLPSARRCGKAPPSSAVMSAGSSIRSRTV